MNKLFELNTSEYLSDALVRISNGSVEDIMDLLNTYVSDELVSWKDIIQAIDDLQSAGFINDNLNIVYNNIKHK